MRKILGLLASISLISTASTAVVSCGSGNERIKNPELNVKLAEKIIAKITGDAKFSLDYGTIFSGGDIAKVVTEMLNTAVSQAYNFESTNNLLQSLDLTTYKTMESFESTFNSLSQTIAEDKLFNEYSKSIVNGNTPLDYKLQKEYYSFNTVVATTVQDVDGKSVDIAAGSYITFGKDGTQWTANAELGVDTEENIPTINDLTEEYSGETSTFKVFGKDDAEIANVSSKTALSLRFQDYFMNSVKISIIEDILTMVYNQGEMFLPQEKEAYISSTNPIFSKTQKWLDDKTGLMTTNVKMAWTLTYNKDKESLVQNTLNALVTGNTLTNDYTLAEKSKEHRLDTIFTGLKTLIDDGTFQADENGYDPFFGKQGYKGFTLYYNDSAVGTSPIAGEKYESNVKTYNERGGIIKNGNYGVGFENKNDSNLKDLVIVLPVSMISLLGGKHNYFIKGATSTAKETNEKQLKLGTNKIFPNKYQDIWNYNQNLKLHNYDIENIDQVQKESMFREIQYLVAQDGTNQSDAKTAVYTKYLDPEEIYYAGLYDQIGQFIKEDENEDQ